MERKRASFPEAPYVLEPSPDTSDRILHLSAGAFALIFGIIGLRVAATRRPSLAHAYFACRAVSTALGLAVSVVSIVGMVMAADVENTVFFILSHAWNALLALYFLKVAKSFRDIVREEITGEGFTPGGGYLPISGVETVAVDPRMRHD